MTILGTATLDAADIDPATLKLAGASVKVKKNGKLRAKLKDVNNDGLDDLVVRIVIQELDLQPGDTTATLEGELFDGTPIVGSLSVTVK